MNTKQFLDQTFNEPAIKDTISEFPPGVYVSDSLLTRDSDTLLVTIGDSWTYGGSLHLLSDIPDVHKFRFDNIYGNRLSAMMNCDWYNLSMPGRSNRWMINQLSKLCEIRYQLPYKKVIVVLTLTETCREFNSHLDMDLDYITNLKNIKHVDEMITVLGKHNAQLILKNNFSDIELIIGQTYVNDSYSGLLDSFSVSKSWLDVLLEKSNAHIPTDKCYVIGSWVFDKLIEIDQLSLLTRSQILDDLTRLIDQGQRRIDYIDASNYNIKKAAYRHPVPEGHQFWAEYMFEQYKNKY